MSSSIQIRRAVQGDAAAVAGLLGELGYPADEATFSRRLAALSGCSDNAIFVAECGGEVAGFVSFHIIPLVHVDGGLGRITALSVGSRFRRHGIGGKLVAAAEVFGWEHGCVEIEVTSGDSRLDAHTFYRAAGYREEIRRFIKHSAPSAGEDHPGPGHVQG